MQNQSRIDREQCWLTAVYLVTRSLDYDSTNRNTVEAIMEADTILTRVWGLPVEDIVQVVHKEYFLGDAEISTDLIYQAISAGCSLTTDDSIYDDQWNYGC